MPDEPRNSGPRDDPWDDASAELCETNPMTCRGEDVQITS